MVAYCSERASVRFLRDLHIDPCTPVSCSVRTKWRASLSTDTTLDKAWFWNRLSVIFSLVPQHYGHSVIRECSERLNSFSATHRVPSSYFNYVRNASPTFYDILLTDTHLLLHSWKKERKKDYIETETSLGHVLNLFAMQSTYCCLWCFFGCWWKSMVLPITQTIIWHKSASLKHKYLT